jgi:hypothetical protein
LSSLIFDTPRLKHPYNIFVSVFFGGEENRHPMMRKGQVKGLRRSNASGQAKFVLSLQIATKRHVLTEVPHLKIIFATQAFGLMRSQLAQANLTGENSVKQKAAPYPDLETCNHPIQLRLQAAI